jgi:hypothetical protein
MRESQASLIILDVLEVEIKILKTYPSPFGLCDQSYNGYVLDTI